MPDHHSFSALDRHAVLGGSDNGFPWYAGAMLAVEASEVVRLRCEKLSHGDEAAGQEAVLMVSEKVASNMALGMDIATGKHGLSAEQITSGSIAHYSKSVKANRRRLAK